MEKDLDTFITSLGYDPELFSEEEKIMHYNRAATKRGEPLYESSEVVSITEPDNRDAILALTPTFSNRSEVGKAQAVKKLEQEALDSNMTPEQYQQLLNGETPDLTPEQLTYKADVLKERAKPNVAEDILLSAGSGVANTLGNTGALILGAPGSISNAISAPDLDTFISSIGYDPELFSEEEKIMHYNRAATKRGEPTYEEQLSSLPTITDTVTGWKDLSKGTVADYEPDTVPGKMAEFTGGLAALGGVGGPVRTAITGAVGSAVDQATEGTAYNLPATILATGVAGGLTRLASGADDVAKAAAARAAAANEARIATDAATRKAGITESMISIAKSKERKLQDIMSLVRVGMGGGFDKSMFSLGDLVKSIPQATVSHLATGMPLTSVVNAGVGAMKVGNLLSRNPAVQQTIRSIPNAGAKSIILESGQIADQPTDIIPLTTGN